jgi:copper transport protein
MLDALAAATRFVLYLGLFTCSGAVFASATSPRGGDLGQYAMHLMRRGAIVTMAAALLSSVLLFFQLGGDPDQPTMLAVFGSSRGAALCLQLAGALLLLASPADEPLSGGIRISNAALLTGSLAVSGHAITEGLLNALVVLLHVSAAAWWIGSLLLMRYAWIHESTALFATAVRQFSGWALRFIVALVAAGAILVVTLVDFSADPLVTPYVRLLILKIALALTVLAIAAGNRWRLTQPVLAGDEAAAAALCRRIDVELIVITVLLAVTAVLVSYTSPT